MLKPAVYYGRMAWQFARFLRMPPVADPRALLCEHLARREESFLALVRRGVFDNPNTPYYHLMRLAGCKYDDLSASVRRDGLETTLEQLRRNGVWLSQAEVKGQPVERHHQIIPNDVAATANPDCHDGIESISSRSRTATPTSNAYRRYREAYESLLLEELDVAGRAMATLQWILPSPNGLVFCAAGARRGNPIERWFTAPDAFRYHAITRILIAQARLLGYALPYPTYLERDDFSAVAKWIAETTRKGRQAFLRGSVSACTRVSAAARDGNIDIAGTVFNATGEALTPAKRALIESTGARVFPRYVATDAGTVGFACSQLKGNSVHVFADSVAVIVHQRPAALSDVTVDSLMFTSTNPYAARILINAESDDAGTIGTASCGCLFSEIGYRTVLRDIYSFGKLTGHGLTLAGTQLLAILEERLPARLGGAPGDYQIVEEEGDTQTEVRLRVSPRVGAVEPQRVRACFLDEIRTLHGGAISRRTWEQTSSLSVEVVEPYRTRTGKVPALHLTRGRQTP